MAWRGIPTASPRSLSRSRQRGLLRVSPVGGWPPSPGLQGPHYLSGGDTCSRGRRGYLVLCPLHLRGRGGHSVLQLRQLLVCSPAGLHGVLGAPGPLLPAGHLACSRAHLGEGSAARDHQQGRPQGSHRHTPHPEGAPFATPGAAGPAGQPAVGRRVQLGPGRWLRHKLLTPGPASECAVPRSLRQPHLLGGPGEVLDGGAAARLRPVTLALLLG